ncbi:MAG: hypothetical protein HKP30_14950 [Myxococcales bacterium]|nr:hypothetical protein [Myxococcales bacterium]
MLRNVVGGAFALLGSLGASADAERRVEPRPTDPSGFRSEGPGYLVWDESRAEIEEWKRSLPPQRIALICGACHEVLQPDGRFAPYTGDLEALRREASHGLCARCARERFPDLLGDA